MKKPIIATVLLLMVVLVLALLVLQSGMQGTPSKKPPTPPISTDVTATDEVPEPTPETTPDPRNEESAVREEIANMLRDAKELIDEGLTIDASRILRDLRTRDLTDAELAQTDALEASMIKISD